MMISIYNLPEIIIEYGVYGDLIYTIYPKPYSIYLKGGYIAKSAYVSWGGS